MKIELKIFKENPSFTIGLSVMGLWGFYWLILGIYRNPSSADQLPEFLNVIFGLLAMFMTASALAIFIGLAALPIVGIIKGIKGYSTKNKPFSLNFYGIILNTCALFTWAIFCGAKWFYG